MANKTIKVNEGEQIDVKRFYVDAIDVYCPNCNSKATLLGNNYLSFPIVGKTEEANGYCGSCDSLLTMPIKINIEVEYDTSKIKFEKDE